MQKKKSYMNQKNILNEGLIDKILDYIKKRKIRQLDKAFKDQPEVRKKINDLNNKAESLEKLFKKLGINHKFTKI